MSRAINLVAIAIPSEAASRHQKSGSSAASSIRTSWQRLQSIAAAIKSQESELTRQSSRPCQHSAPSCDTVVEIPANPRSIRISNSSRCFKLQGSSKMLRKSSAYGESLTRTGMACSMRNQSETKAKLAGPLFMAPTPLTSLQGFMLGHRSNLGFGAVGWCTLSPGAFDFQCLDRPAVDSLQLKRGQAPHSKRSVDRDVELHHQPNLLDHESGASSTCRKQNDMKLAHTFSLEAAQL